MKVTVEEFTNMSAQPPRRSLGTFTFLEEFDRGDEGYRLDQEIPLEGNHFLILKSTRSNYGWGFCFSVHYRSGDGEVRLASIAGAQKITILEIGLPTGRMIHFLFTEWQKQSGDESARP